MNPFNGIPELIRRRIVSLLTLISDTCNSQVRAELKLSKWKAWLSDVRTMVTEGVVDLGRPAGLRVDCDCPAFACETSSLSSCSVIIFALAN